MAKISVVLAIRHTLIRQALRVFLENSNEFTILNETADAGEISEMVSAARPDILLVDVTVLAFSGPAIVRSLSKRHPDSRIVVLSLFGKDPAGLDWVHGEEAGYLFCGGNTANLIGELNAAIAGGPRPLAVMEEIDSQPSRPRDDRAGKTLTPREREVLLQAAEGYTSSEIAQRLSIGSRTVEGHRARAMRGLGLRTTTDLIRYAMQNGWISD